MNMTPEIKAAAERRRVYLEGPRYNNKSCGSDPLHDLVILADAYLDTCHADDDDIADAAWIIDLAGPDGCQDYKERVYRIGNFAIDLMWTQGPVITIQTQPSGVTRGQVRKLLEALQIGGGK